jgi:hypothetical protein
MFVTIERVKELTGKDVDLELVRQAQSVVETYIGRVEAEVIDPNDLAILSNATAYQTAYMEENPGITFEQVAVLTAGQSESAVQFDIGKWAPFLAPLTFMACRRLSWKRSRSVHVGPIFERPYDAGWAYRWLFE